MSGIPEKTCPHGSAHGAARSITSDDITCFDRFLLTQSIIFGAFQMHSYGIIQRFVIHAEVCYFQIIIGPQPCRRAMHHIQKHIVNTRLIDQNMGHFAQPVFNILNANHADNVVRFNPIWRPKGCFVDPD